MTRSEVRDFIEAGVNAVGGMTFGSGLITDFNSKADKQYPTAWLETVESSPDTTDHGLVSDNWQINLHIGKLDKIDSSPETYEAIIDDCDLLAIKLFNQYDNEVEGSSLVTLTGYSRDSFTKKHADCITGVLLSFTLNAPQTSNAICD